MYRHADFDRLDREWGIRFPGAMDYLPQSWRQNAESREASALGLAMDAMPPLVSTANSGIPAFLTTFIDPDIINILQAPSTIAQILGEVRKGSWLDQTAMFPVVETTGDVASYDDYSPNGRAGANVEFEQRQAYLFQTNAEWGQLEMERMGLARIGWAATKRQSAIKLLNKASNLSYAFGIAGLQNYGLLNDPSLTAYLTPSVKANGGVQWIKSGAINATANEVFADIQALYGQLVLQTNGLVALDSPLVLALAPNSAWGLTATNSFGINVRALLKETFPKLRIEQAVQYGVSSGVNNQGIAGGNVVQLIAEEVDGQDTGFSAFNDKLHAFPVVVKESSFNQKMAQGTWGTIIKMPMAIAQMQGI